MPSVDRGSPASSRLDARVHGLLAPAAAWKEERWHERKDGEPDRPPEGGVEGGDTHRRGQNSVARDLAGEDDRENRRAE